MSYRRPTFQFFLRLFTRAETAINHVWGERFNFFYFLGSLPVILLFVLLFTGLFMFIYYNMSASSSYESVKYMTEHATLGRFMRNLHRYASDAMMFFVILHMLRVLFEEKFQNHRTLAWITGVIIMLIMMVQGITGYILPLDTNSRFVMEKTSEILAGLRVFGDTLPRSFSSPALLGKWIMWVVLIVHLIIPLFFILLLFVHLLRVSRAKLFPPRQMTLAFVALLAVYTLIFPIPMAGKAEAEKMPELLQPDWFYLFFAPVFENRFSLYIWLAMGATVVLLFAMPWLFKRRAIIPAVVTPEKCTGCTLCATDCPYQAMHMVERADNSRHKLLVSIDTSLCSGCGICAGSCSYGAIDFAAPTTPKGLEDEAVQGKWVTLICQSRAHTLGLTADSCTSISDLPDTAHHLEVMTCSGKLGASRAEEIRAAGAMGIIVGACPGSDCWYREGNTWLKDRLAESRKPRIRSTAGSLAGGTQAAATTTAAISPAEFPIVALSFSGTQKGDFTRAVTSIVKNSSYLNKPIPVRLFEILKPSQWAYSFSMSTLALTLLLWIFFLGSSGRFGAVTHATATSLLRLDFFYLTDKKTCSPDMIPPGAREAALERMAGLVKLDNLTPEARERVLQQASDSVASKYCSRARRDLDITVTLDGKQIAERSFKPTGLQNDGIVYALLKQTVTPGKHSITVLAHEKDTGSVGRKTDYAAELVFEDGEVKLIDFEPNQARVFLRTTPTPTEQATGKE